MEQMLAVLKQRQDNDQCMAIEIRSGKTTIERQVPRKDSNKEENITDLVEARERHNKLADPCIEGHDAPLGQSKESCIEGSLSRPGMCTIEEDSAKSVILQYSGKETRIYRGSQMKENE
ncbi:hypothetical protein HAX54_039643, partial [Datura stramonium]|nr:hypothetical protein [Datura stramonium]